MSIHADLHTAQAPPTIAQDSLLQGGMFMYVCGVDTQNRIQQKFVRLEILSGQQNAKFIYYLPVWLDLFWCYFCGFILHKSDDLWSV